MNAALAIAALQAADIQVTDEAIARGLSSVEWPARFQIWNERIVIDGAHNPAGAKILAQTWREEFGNERAIVVLAILRDKNAAEIVDALRPIATKFLLPPIRGERALPPHDLSSIFSFKTPSLPHSVTPSLAEALTAARKTKQRIHITGSLHFAGEALAFERGDPNRLEEYAQQILRRSLSRFGHDSRNGDPFS